MRRLVGLTMLGIALAMPASHARAENQGDGAAVTAQQIAWREGDVEDAFGEAKEVNKPVLLYWGAKWCPPCNLMKQTLFKDPSFIAETRNFIPVHLDGDAKDAQIWGQKFGIRGYPTVIVLLPDRTEVTRLDGGATTSALTDVLKVAARRTISTEELLKRAESPASLSTDDWHLLASFDWTDDPKHFGDLKKAAAFVAQLADAAPDAAVKRHFKLTSLLMANNNADVAKLTPEDQAEFRAILPAILANYDEVKANRQELSDGVASLILGLPDPTEKQALSKKLVRALDRLAADDSVPLDDRLLTASAEVALSKAANGGKVAPGVMAKVRERVAMADKAAMDPSMRQAVMPDAGELLADAGDKEGAEQLWEAELPHAVAPYYYMLDLAHLAEAGKDNKAAIGWLKKAAEAAQGPATRIQWAISYSNGVIRMAPDDKVAVAESAGMVIETLGRNNSGYAERTEEKITIWSQKLRDWGAKHDGAEVLTQLSAKMDQACVKGGCKNELKT
ncbi:MAG TPA: thioredoxin family protein [Aliidongia sp.]|nr:thioredoxin family protein [Aliidongia sp.]